MKLHHNTCSCILITLALAANCNTLLAIHDESNASHSPLNKSHPSSSSHDYSPRRYAMTPDATRYSVEEELAAARAAILRASTAASTTNISSYGDDAEFMPNPNIYRNPAAFVKSYQEMEKRFKVYVYEEGDPPLVHDGPCKSIYSIEGRFIQDLEMMRPLAREGGLRTWEPQKAHAFFLPFSVAQMVKYVYQPHTDFTTISRLVSDYVDVVASKYPFWNRTAGADHFMVACHDWGPIVSLGKPELFNNSIRALCNANTTEGFQPQKDVSIPEFNLVSGVMAQQLLSRPPIHRPFLAFFAGGGNHGPVRPSLLKHWKDRDDKLQVHEYLPKGVDYYEFMLTSRFCLCPSGYEVASPRIVESIFAGCVPVIMSEGYVLPFSDVLRWDEFSVTVVVEDIPRLKEILEGIPEEKLERLREGVRAVKRHFELNQPAKKYDVFHMILHSVWLRRLNVRLF